MSGEETIDSGIVKRALDALAELKQTPVGIVIYDQISQIVQEHESMHSKLERTYGLLLHLLLDVYAQNPTSESVTRLNAQIIQLRQAQAAGPMRHTMLDLSHVFATAAPSPAKTESAPRAPSEHTSFLHSVNTANTTSRRQTDRKHDDTEDLQQLLSKILHEAITHNREFGALLHIKLGALKQAESTEEVENLRQILIGGVEELIKGQRLLDSKLHQSGGYLNMIRADNQRLRDELHKVRTLSLTDEFTGLPNRRAFLRRLQDEIGRAQRYNTPLALVLIDLDDFKGINDMHGHGAGDDVLHCYANRVLSILRHHDMVARYGGDEFTVILPNTSEKGAMAAVEKARHRAREAFCKMAEKAIKMPTFSAGLAMYQVGESPMDFIERADRALYCAKSMGGDRSEMAATPLAAASATTVDPERQETA